MKKRALIVLIAFGLMFLCLSDEAISAEKGFYISLGTGFGTAGNINMIVSYLEFERLSRQQPCLEYLSPLQ